MLSKAFDLSAILELPFSMELIHHAIEKEKDIAAWELWVSLYPLMAIKVIKPQKYSDFKEAVIQKSFRYTEVTDEEVMAEMLAVIHAYEGR